MAGKAILVPQTPSIMILFAPPAPPRTRNQLIFNAHNHKNFPLRDRVGREILAFAGMLDISFLLKAPLLPSKMLILLAAACGGWIALLSLALMAFTGTGMAAGWIFAGAMFLALIVWTVVMCGEFRSAPAVRAEQGLDDELMPVSTAPLPRSGGIGLVDRLRFNHPVIRRCQPLAVARMKRSPRSKGR